MLVCWTETLFFSFVEPKKSFSFSSLFDKVVNLFLPMTVFPLCEYSAACVPVCVSGGTIKERKILLVWKTIKFSTSIFQSVNALST